MSHMQKFIGGLIVIAVLIPALAQTEAKTRTKKSEAAQATSAGTDDSARGQKVFEQNCSRCHNAPEGFPPQISGTIVRHMRVRASLNAADERATLRFLNP